MAARQVVGEVGRGKSQYRSVAEHGFLGCGPKRSERYGDLCLPQGASVSSGHGFLLAGETNSFRAEQHLIVVLPAWDVVDPAPLVSDYRTGLRCRGKRVGAKRFELSGLDQRLDEVDRTG